MRSLDLRPSYHPPNLNRIHPGRGGMSRRTTTYNLPPLRKAIQTAPSFEEARELYQGALRKLKRASSATKRGWFEALLARAPNSEHAAALHLEACAAFPDAPASARLRWRRVVEGMQERERVQRLRETVSA